jgi:hypothetical protein
MEAIRESLNERWCEPLKITYDLSGNNTFAMRLEFASGEDLEAFESCFTG